MGTEDDEILRVTPGSLSAGDTLDAGEGTDTLQMVEASELDLTAPDVFAGYEIVEGSDGNDIIIANDDRLQGLIIKGGDGIDTLRMATAGTFNLTGTELNGIEGIEGSDGNDIIIADNDRLEALQSIDGKGGTNVMRLEGSDAFDLTALTVANLSKIVLTEETGTLVTVSDQATALLLRAEASDNDQIILSGDTFSLAQRWQLFRQGFETVTDAGGTYTNAAPTRITLDNTSVDELARPGTRVGVLLAEDPDEEEKFTYDLLDDAGGRFVLSSNEILVRNGLALDFEQASSHTILVRVTDGGGKSWEQELTISVNNISPEIATGTAGADRLVGGNGNDRFSGLQGNDILIGGGGHDSLNGGDGNDSLSGDLGNDTLFGGAGKDTLIGGAGKDRFVFTAKVDKKSWKANVDMIVDYKPKDDTILLDNAVFKKLGKKGSLTKPAKLNKNFFTVGSKAKDKNDYLIFDPKKKVLLYDADGSGKGAAYQIATFDKKLKLTMTAAEFLVI